MFLPADHHTPVTLTHNMDRSTLFRAYYPRKKTLPEVPADTIRDLLENDMIQAFCEVPILRYFNTKSIPGLGKDEEFRKYLKSHLGIRNPLDLVLLLRSKTKGCRFRFDEKVSILYDFFQEASTGLESRRYLSKTAASVSIVIMDSKVPRNFRNHPLCI